MNRGVVILAVKKPVYGKMAYNLAMSIKFPDPDMRVQLVYDKEAVSSLSDSQLDMFDVKTEISESLSNMCVGELKTRIYDFSCFEETLSIDADSIMFPTSKISRIFDEMDEIGTYYQPFYRNSFRDDKDKLMYGFTLGDCRDNFEYYHFGGTAIHEVNSHFVYFIKIEETKRFFDVAQEVYGKLSNGLLDDKIPKWQGMVPDEAAFSIATFITGMHPDIKGWQPIHDVWSEVGSFNHVTGAVGMIGKYGLTMQGDEDSNREQFYDYVCMLLKIKYQVNDLFRWEKK